jgi:large conductance mechanosensitive channel
VLKGFKEFIMQRNIVDLAVAVVIGTAVYALVAAFTESFINPLLAAAGSEALGEGLGFQLGPEGNAATFVNIGAFITAVFTFLITAAVVYFLIVAPMNKLQERRARGKEPEPEPLTDDVRLLQEIRDLLAERGATDSTSSDAGTTSPSGRTR